MAIEVQFSSTFSAQSIEPLMVSSEGGTDVLLVGVGVLVEVRRQYSFFTSSVENKIMRALAQ